MSEVHKIAGMLGAARLRAQLNGADGLAIALETARAILDSTWLAAREADAWDRGFQDAADKTPMPYAPDGPTDQQNPFRPAKSCGCHGHALGMPDMCDRGYPTSSDLARMDLQAWVKRQREALPERREEWAHGIAQTLHDLTLELDRIFGPENAGTGDDA